MIIFHLLTAILFLLKVLGFISVSWLTVIAPSLITISISLLIYIFALIAAVYELRK